MDIRNYLNGKGFTWKEVKRPKGLQAVMNCPFCQNDTEQKFAISLDSGAFQCLHKNKCGVSGSFWQFQQMLGDKPKSLNSDYNNSIKNYRKKVYSKPNKENIKKADESIYRFFEKRKISSQTVDKFKIVLSKNNIAFPYFKDGELTGIKYRSLTEKKFYSEKNCEPVLYNMDACNNNDTLYICEGEIDCMSLSEYGIDAVSLPSGVNSLDWIENLWTWLEQFNKIFLIMDMDEAGQSAVNNIANRLGKWRCYNVQLPDPHKDVNECLMMGVEKEEIYNCFLTATDFKDSKINSADYYKDEIIELINQKEKLYGVKTGFDKLDEILKGWRMQEWTVWTGRNASGKTSFINQVILGLTNRQERCLIISLEMKPKRLLRWMIMQDCQQKYLSDEMVNDSLDRIGPYLYLIDVQGRINKERLLDMFQFCARKYGVKHFFIDNMIGIDLNPRYILEEQKQFAAEINNFTQEYDCHVHLVAHPRKGFKDSDRPDKVDVSGSGDITNLAFNVISIYRPTVEERERAVDKGFELPDMILNVKKNREWGTEGKVNFGFDEDAKLFIER